MAIICFVAAAVLFSCCIIAVATAIPLGIAASPALLTNIYIAAGTFVLGCAVLGYGLKCWKRAHNEEEKELRARGP